MSVKADFALSCSAEDFTEDYAMQIKETIIIDSGRGQFMLQSIYPQGEEKNRYANMADLYWLPIRRSITTDLEYRYTQNHHFESGISSITVDRRVSYIKVKYSTKKLQRMIRDSQKVEKLVKVREYSKNCRLLDTEEKMQALNIVRKLQEKSRKYGDDGLNQDDPGKTKI